MPDTYTPVLTDEQIEEVFQKAAFGPGQQPSFARAIERAAIEAYQRRQKENLTRLFAAIRPQIAAAAAAGQHVTETPYGPVFLSLASDDPAAPDLPTSSVDNQVENRMTDPHQQESEQACGDQIKE